MGVYPFMFGSVKDFEPVADAIIQVCTITTSAVKILIIE